MKKLQEHSTCLNNKRITPVTAQSASTGFAFSVHVYFLTCHSGIGYFTLPYLVHGGASFVHACEWNPDAAMALKRNLELNSVAERCAVHQGDNRQVCARTDSLEAGYSSSVA